ncbi:hypothetical protein L6R50_03400 [Myxococcota bacterium]|nr:hypothetical protein [Myxococcota bacterium]
MSPRPRSRTKLPEALRPLFWEYDFDELSWEEDLDLVAGKVLEHGAWRDLLWLRHTLGDEALRGWIAKRQGRGLSARDLRFWEVVLRIPHAQVTAWIEQPGKAIWERRTAPRP